MTEPTRSRRGVDLAAANLAADLEEALRYLNSAEALLRAVSQDAPQVQGVRAWAQQLAARLEAEGVQVLERIADISGAPRSVPKPESWIDHDLADQAREMRETEEAEELAESGELAPEQT